MKELKSGGRVDSTRHWRVDFEEGGLHGYHRAKSKRVEPAAEIKTLTNNGPLGRRGG